MSNTRGHRTCGALRKVQREVVCVKRSSLEENPHIVREFKIGNTRIKIADNYCAGKTKEEVQRILKEIAATAQIHLSAAARRSE